jgi:hypothetical protein
MVNGSLATVVLIDLLQDLSSQEDFLGMDWELGNGHQMTGLRLRFRLPLGICRGICKAAQGWWGDMEEVWGLYPYTAD